MSEPSPVHSGPSNLNRAAAGGLGILLAPIVLFFVIDEWKLISEPPPFVRECMAGAVVVVTGGAYSKWLGAFFEALGQRILRTVRGTPE